jgi:hypothetical protein
VAAVANTRSANRVFSNFFSPGDGFGRAFALYEVKGGAVSGRCTCCYVLAAVAREVIDRDLYRRNTLSPLTA